MKQSRLMKLVFEAGTANADEVLAKVRDKLAEARKIKGGRLGHSAIQRK